MKKRLFAVGLMAAAVFALTGSALACDEEPEDELWCVKHEGFVPPEGCLLVESVRDLPPNATFLPAHGGLTDPDEVERFWREHSDPAVAETVQAPPEPVLAELEITSVEVEHEASVTTLNLLGNSSISLHS